MENVHDKPRRRRKGYLIAIPIILGVFLGVCCWQNKFSHDLGVFIIQGNFIKSTATLIPTPHTTAKEAAERGVNTYFNVNYETGFDKWSIGLAKVSALLGNSFKDTKKNTRNTWESIIAPQEVKSNRYYDAVEMVYDSPFWLKESRDKYNDIDGRSQIWKMVLRDHTCQSKGDFCLKEETFLKTNKEFYVYVTQAYHGLDLNRGWLFDHILTDWEEENLKNYFAARTAVVMDAMKTHEVFSTAKAKTQSVQNATATRVSISSTETTWFNMREAARQELTAKAQETPIP
ncbi:MAG: hypothetical protein LWX83_12025 [Anaerolineae bacterium]|nr:hypothetical protein [Anaerolineae bacterium]